MNARPSTRVACSGPATPGVRRWALGPVRLGIRGRFLLLALSLLWPTQAWAQVTPPPAPTTGEMVEYYATDALGSIRVVFTVSGAEVARADYQPFGERFHTTGPLPSQQFTGQQRDPEAQLDQFNARSYQTTTGRFTGIDPVHAGMFDPQQWNRYGYARANPLKYVDPQGLETFRISVNCSETFNVGCTQDPKAGTGPVGPSAWFLFGGMSPFGISYPERTLPLSFFTKGNRRPSRDDPAIGGTGANVDNPESPDDPVAPNEAKPDESTNACTRTGSSTCVAQCIDRRRFNLAATAGTLAAYGASMPIDKDRVIYKNQPYTNRISKLAGKWFGGRTTTTGSAMRATGRYLSKYSPVVVIAEGFYDWYVIGDCVTDCRSNPCAH